MFSHLKLQQGLVFSWSAVTSQLFGRKSYMQLGFPDPEQLSIQWQSWKGTWHFLLKVTLMCNSKKKQLVTKVPTQNVSMTQIQCRNQPCGEKWSSSAAYKRLLSHVFSCGLMGYGVRFVLNQTHFHNWYMNTNHHKPGLMPSKGI